MAKSFDITTDEELTARVRSETSYENTPDELPQAQLDEIIEGAKHKTFLETGQDTWFSDSGLGFALAAYVKMRAKASVENFAIQNYNLGDQQVTTRNADPDDSQQIQQWADDVATGLENSSDVTSTGGDPTISNTAGYIGDDHIHVADSDDHD